MDFNYVIPNIIRGMEIIKGEQVILNFWGDNKDLDILDSFMLEVLKVGGKPIRVHQSREFLKRYFEEASSLELFDKEYFESLKHGDVVIDIFTYGPNPHKYFPKEKMGLYREYMKNLFSSLFQDKRLFIQVRVPTEENASEEGIDYEVYKETMINAMNVDYTMLKSETKRIIEKLENKQKVEIYTEDNNILSFNIENRKWNKDDGIGDIPCGEVYIAPVEESANGTVLIPKVNLGEDILNEVLLEFKDGKLINSSHRELMDFVNQFPGDSDKIAEFGIGLNENVKEIIGYSLIDEKCKGTIHIAIGANKMFGGNNESPLHFDFVFTPSLLKLDDEIFIIN